MSETILLMDSCTDVLVVAVMCDEELIAGITEPAGPLKGARLLPLIEEVMAEAQLGYDDLAAVAAGRGPGTFTGIRTSLATALGIAAGRDIPAYGLCPMLALGGSITMPYGTRTLVTIDARRGGVYVRSMLWTDAGIPIAQSSPELYEQDDIPQHLLEGHHLIESHSHKIQPQGLVRSFLALRQDDACPPPTPLYIRPPDAKPRSSL